MCCSIAWVDNLRSLPPRGLKPPQSYHLCALPLLPPVFVFVQVGDWLLFPSMGAYTLCGASKFNGIDATAPATFYVCSHKP